jgi:activating signal cointegrator complex subunit 2
LGFVTCAPESLCDALERVARETCSALGGAADETNASAGQSSSSSSRTDASIADAANAVRAAVLRGRDALLALDGDAGGGTVPRRDDGPDDATVRSYGTRAERFSVLGAEASAAPPPPAALARKVRETRELFPEHGEGFLAAALEAFGNDVGETASRLLEGDLPPALAAMDVGADWAAYWAEKNPAPASGDGGGKRRGHDTGTNDAFGTNTNTSVWTNGVSGGVSFARRISEETAAYHKNGDVAYMTRRQKSAYGFENGYDASEAKRHILDLAYDDEYDDSFDELNELAGAVADAGGDAAERRSFGVFGGGVSGGRAGAPGAPGAPGETKKTFWIENGRVYHAARPGATAVSASSVEEASALAAREAAVAGAQVHGLGAGGNRAAFGAAGARPASSLVSHATGGGRGGRGAPPSDLTRPDPRPLPGSSAGPNRRGAGAPAGTRAHKNEHKASLGNHNRKKAAAKKMSKGFGPAPTGGE